jgi:hypothetical protein
MRHSRTIVQNLGSIGTTKNKPIARKSFAFVKSEIPNDAVTPCRTEGYPDMWFSYVPDEVAAAKAYCRTCPFMNQCALEAELRNEKHGVWGGIYRREGRIHEGPRPTGRPPKVREVTK